MNEPQTSGNKWIATLGGGLLAILLLASAFVAGFYCANRSRFEPRYAPLMPIVLVPENASDRQFASAAKVCRTFFAHTTPRRANRNPVCCVWIEIVPTLSAGLEDGYVISHNGSATAISATSPDALDRAVDAFVASSKTISGRVMAPTGIQTSYPVRHHPK